MMQRHLEFLLPFHVDAHGIVFQMRVGTGRHNVECVEDFVHFVLQFVKFIASHWELQYDYTQHPADRAD